MSMDSPAAMLTDLLEIWVDGADRVWEKRVKVWSGIKIREENNGGKKKLNSGKKSREGIGKADGVSTWVCLPQRIWVENSRVPR
jgi:hypothetical protein